MEIRIITKALAAREVGVSPSTIYEWAKSGKINKYVTGVHKTFKVSEKEVTEYKRKYDECHKV